MYIDSREKRPLFYTYWFNVELPLHVTLPPKSLFYITDATRPASVYQAASLQNYMMSCAVISSDVAGYKILCVASPAR